jgi:hypothetical protein
MTVEDLEHPMTDQAPAVITRYLTAADDRDALALAACFTTDGSVLDESQTFIGHDAIAAWREGLASTYTYTSTVTGSEPQPDGSYRISAHLEGNFPGGVADLAYTFTLRDELIAALTIM